MKDEEIDMVARLRELRAEFQRGQEQMAALDRERAELRDTLLRISGAIQVLEELLARDAEATRSKADPAVA